MTDFLLWQPPYKSNSLCTEKNNNFFPIRWAQSLWILKNEEYSFFTLLKNTISWKEHKIAFLICWNLMFFFFRLAICSTEVLYFKSFRKSFLYVIVSEDFFSRSEEKKYPHFSELFNSIFLWLHNILLVYIPVHVRINITLPSAYVVSTPCSSHLLSLTISCPSTHSSTKQSRQQKGPSTVCWMNEGADEGKIQKSFFFSFINLIWNTSVMLSLSKLNISSFCRIHLPSLLLNSMIIL